MDVLEKENVFFVGLLVGTVIGSLMFGLAFLHMVNKYNELVREINAFGQ